MGFERKGDASARNAKIAYLVMCHRDPDHIVRLALKLTSGDPDCAVFIHVDGKSNIAVELALRLDGRERVYMTERRIDVYWGGYDKIKALYELLRLSFDMNDHDRFVILQGADYPIKSPSEISDFFGQRPDQEFIRACDSTGAKSKYLYSKARYVLFFDRPNILKKIANKVTRMLDLKLRSGVVTVDGRTWRVYWGSAQIAFTRPLAELFLSYEGNLALDRFFRTCFSGDEVFFQTITFNSDFVRNTTDGKPIAETHSIRLASTRNICYFEYPDVVTVFTEADFERLCNVDELFIRKVATDKSTGLLDRIDALHERQRVEIEISS